MFLRREFVAFFAEICGFLKNLEVYKRAIDALKGLPAAQASVVRMSKITCSQVKLIRLAGGSSPAHLCSAGPNAGISRHTGKPDSAIAARHRIRIVICVKNAIFVEKRSGHLQNLHGRSFARKVLLQSGAQSLELRTQRLLFLDRIAAHLQQLQQLL